MPKMHASRLYKYMWNGFACLMRWRVFMHYANSTQELGAITTSIAIDRLLIAWSVHYYTSNSRFHLVEFLGFI